eukprot:TRINITY_DN6902_c0_g1_i3.p1 TRINITY_DN6902_c0_g1~~TRINITY_DN6902_c0_g1_i3.p1  ORF type:complete len:102 (-),score=27.24 TRINITY_DN6902_c0_g1_i3:406-711(-)
MGRSSRRSTTSSMKRDDTDRGAEQKAEKWPFWPLCSQDGGAEQKAEKWPFWPLCFQEAGREQQAAEGEKTHCTNGGDEGIDGWYIVDDDYDDEEKEDEEVG